ncbi:MAG TPA: CmpA/NrtA family ABC transporter substrate-binding protein [Verrucomicrobiae bacterium]|jgi:ABC-type nitrate/sulfonate/bicarbonate transport system substrate-binding protein|nr:CmpA/NrtA family ABC transporter substrate-binding protein [Verrucomicrobiae bacterium]
MRFAKSKSRNGKLRNHIELGFVATIDCAIVIAAQELGLFEKYGLTVRLSREVGWATIREKLSHEELDAAAAHASMLFSIYCGIGVVRRSCLTGMLLGAHGSAITLSNELWDLGVRDAASLGRVIRQHKGSRVFVFAVVLGLSSQNYNLRQWLRSGGIDPDLDVRVIVIPSALVYETYQGGHLDGYCVAEPWNSAASLSGNGWVAVATSEIEPWHPEKVLLVLQDFAENREEEHIRMLAAMIEASQYCDVPGNRPELVRMLAQPRYFDVDQRLLANALVGPFDCGHGRRDANQFIIYDGFKVGRPTHARGKWVLDLVRTLSASELSPVLRPEIIGKVFRDDIFEKAAAFVRSSEKKKFSAAPPAPFVPNGASIIKHDERKTETLLALASQNMPVTCPSPMIFSEARPAFLNPKLFDPATTLSV